MGKKCGWRRRRDSNPRDGFPPTPLAGERLRPLGHVSTDPYRGPEPPRTSAIRTIALFYDHADQQCFKETDFHFSTRTFSGSMKPFSPGSSASSPACLLSRRTVCIPHQEVPRNPASKSLQKPSGNEARHDQARHDRAPRQTGYVL